MTLLQLLGQPVRGFQYTPICYYFAAGHNMVISEHLAQQLIRLNQ